MGGGWSGLTFPAALMFRAYILASPKPDRDVVGLALTWFLHQICDDGSCFHEPARTAAMIETFYILYEFATNENGKYLEFSSNYDQFLASINRLVEKKKNGTETDFKSQSADYRNLDLNNKINKLKKVNKGLAYALIALICLIILFILAILFIYYQNLLSLLFGFIGAIPVCFALIMIILKHIII